MMDGRSRHIPENGIVFICIRYRWLFDLTETDDELRPKRIDVSSNHEDEYTRYIKFFSDNELILATGDNVLAFASIRENQAIVLDNVSCVVSPEDLPFSSSSLSPGKEDGM